MKVTVQDAINGADNLTDTRQPYGALQQFYRALNTRDRELMARNWDSSEDAAMDNPLGGIKRGWNEIASVYERLFSANAEFHFEFYDYSLHLSENIFYVVGRERGRFSKNWKTLDLAIRTTRIFRKADDGNWRQVHHHGSIEDPQLLAEYQQAVR